MDGSARGGATEYDVLIGSGALMGRGHAGRGGIAIQLWSPELAAPIKATLVAADTPREWHLIWSPASG